MKIVQVAATVDDAGAGPTYSVRGLSEGLAQIAGTDIRIRAVEGWRNGSEAISESSTPVLRSGLGRGPAAKYLCTSPKLSDALYHDTNSVDIIHTHGLWLMPNVYPARAVRITERQVKLVHSIRGMLSGTAMNFSTYKKQAFWAIAQKKAVQAANCLHATAYSEYQDIRSMGLRNPVAIIPNGVDIPDQSRFASPRKKASEVLSLGRLHPKKNLRSLLIAWAQIEKEYPDWRLRIAGPAEDNHDQELLGLVNSLGLKRAEVSGPIYGKERAMAYEQADLFVLPTLNENFAMTVAESLASGTPVISTKGAPWSGLITQRCGWWIDHGITELAQAMDAAMQMPAIQRIAMGRRGREWMLRDFSWTKIAMDMHDVYGWLANGGDVPKTVYID